MTIQMISDATHLYYLRDPNINRRNPFVDPIYQQYNVSLILQRRVTNLSGHVIHSKYLYNRILTIDDNRPKNQ